MQSGFTGLKYISVTIQVSKSASFEENSFSTHQVRDKVTASDFRNSAQLNGVRNDWANERSVIAEK